MIQLDHERRLQATGTITRAHNHLPPEWLTKTTAISVGLIETSRIYPTQPDWITIRFTEYTLTEDKVKLKGWSDIPVAEDYGDIQVPWEGFIPEDVALIVQLRQELLDARDSGQLPNLRSDLSKIQS